MTGTAPWTALYPEGIEPALALPTRTVLDAFVAASRSVPADVGLCYFQRHFTFAQLDELVVRVGAVLRARGVEPGDRVAVLGQNTPTIYLTALGAWRVGAVLVPLNPMLTARELAVLLDDSGATAVVAEADLTPALAAAIDGASPVESVIVSRARDLLPPDDIPDLVRSTVEAPEVPPGWELLSSGLEEADPRAVGSRGMPSVEMPALLTYTSGTTGQPKAAVNSHANVAFSAEVYRRWLALGPDDTILGAAPLFHITGMVAHLAASITSRAPLVLGYRFEPATMLRLIAMHGCTTTVAAITAYIALLDHPDFASTDLTTFTKLFSGGAPVAPGVVDRWEQATGAYIHNAYGLTETTSPSHLVPLGRRAPVDDVSGALSVGVPVPNTECRVVELGSDRDVAPGEVGELLTRGPQVVGSYWQRPEETQRSISDGWLRTGDVCRRDEAGWFYIVDRAKDVIIASGFNVWPREVEDVLLGHPAVSEVAVVGVPDSYRGESPKAFVVRRPAAEVTPDELVAFAREELAAYKVPRQVELVAELPKTASGKVLRRTLRGDA